MAAAIQVRRLPGVVQPGAGELDLLIQGGRPRNKDAHRGQLAMEGGGVAEDVLHVGAACIDAQQRTVLGTVANLQGVESSQGQVGVWVLPLGGGEGTEQVLCPPSTVRSRTLCSWHVHVWGENVWEVILMEGNTCERQCVGVVCLQISV
jgi:hypothetical protein